MPLLPGGLRRGGREEVATAVRAPTTPHYTGRAPRAAAYLKHSGAAQKFTLSTETSFIAVQLAANALLPSENWAHHAKKASCNTQVFILSLKSVPIKPTIYFVSMNTWQSKPHLEEQIGNVFFGKGVKNKSVYFQEQTVICLAIMCAALSWRDAIRKRGKHGQASSAIKTAWPGVIGK